MIDSESTHDDGKALETKRSEAQRFDKTQVIAICFGETMEGIYVTISYTLAAYMVRSFLEGEAMEPKAREAKIGQLTGLLAATFCAFQFLTTFPLGLLSNRVGRKPVMVLSQLSGVASCVAFGLSPNYALALASRAIGGALNNTGGTVRIMLSESCSPEVLPRAFAWQSLGWGLGTLLGPAIGGGLSSPCTSFGINSGPCRPGGLFQIRPFLLPCLAAAALGLVGVILCIFFLTESMPSAQRRAQGCAGVEHELVAVNWEHLPLSDDSLPSCSVAKEVTAASNPLQPLDANIQQQPSPRRQRSPRRNHSDLENQLPDDIKQDSRVLPKAHAVLEFQQQDENGAACAAAEAESLPLIAQQDEGQRQGRVDRPWYKQGQVMLSFMLYIGTAAAFNYLDELRPIFASAPIKEGGLGLRSDVLAWCLIFGGIVFILFSWAGFERFHDLVGTIGVSRMGMLGLGVSAMLSVLPSLFPYHAVLVQVSLFAAMGCNAIADTSAFAGSCILLNEAAPPADMADVTNISQALTSLMRALGPASSGFAWGIAVHSALPIHQFFPFFLIVASGIVMQQCYSFVRRPSAAVPG